ncbi:hypothetical protein K270103H11_29230 [Gordonibacter urolithinfaciens]
MRRVQSDFSPVFSGRGTPTPAPAPSDSMLATSVLTRRWISSSWLFHERRSAHASEPAVIDAAANLIAREGSSKITNRRVAEEAGAPDRRGSRRDSCSSE